MLCVGRTVELQNVCQVYTVAGVNDLYATCSGSCRHVKEGFVWFL